MKPDRTSERNSALRAAPIVAAVLLLLAAGPHAAGAGPDPGGATAEEKKLDDLEARIAELEAQLRALQAGGGPQADMEELRRRLDLLAAEVEKLRLGRSAADKPLEGAHGLGPAASKVYGVPKGVSIGGYGEVLYENFSASRDDGAASGKTDRFDLLRAVIYLGYKFNDTIVFNSEIEFEHASTGDGGEVSVEFSYLDFLLNEHANARAGLLLVPAGFINEIHEPPTFLGARRPDVERRIIPSTWRSNGAGVFGDAGRFSYRAYLLTGLDSSGFSADDAIRGGRQNGARENAEDFAFTARVDYHGIPGLLAGAFWYQGGSSQGARAPVGPTLDPNGAPLSPPTTSFDARVTLYDLHAEYRARGLSFRALWAAGTVGDAKQVNDARGLDGTDSVGSRFHGWYAEAGWDVLSLRGKSEAALVPFIRYERFDTQAAVPGEAPQDLDSDPLVSPAPFAADPANDVKLWTYGIVYRPILNVALKADYQDYGNAAGTGVDQFNVAIGFLF